MVTDRVAAIRHLCLSEAILAGSPEPYFTSWMPMAPPPWMGPAPTGPELM
jgi:hypothetical protein